MPTKECALALRDGGIDAVAALMSALSLALKHVPHQHHSNVKQAPGQAMADVLDATVHPAVRTFPDLEPDDDTWEAVVKVRAASRAGL